MFASTTSILLLLVVLLACFVTIDAQWGYGGWGRPYGGYGYGRGMYGGWGRPMYGGWGRPYGGYGGYGWGK